ncbi:DUF3732 domain-containing protein [Sphingobacterium multivorum]|uniref:DUF3732 domain-containing protein n=1 Tax=Sphingobacterium multivorum TaxID=28454 RepID=A0A653XIC9_SPHMU|nr:DUF3732 domain-containing protein [Sphingobacterium multivorum]QQT43489.1 DUF3732 domain-containing protein [Sphingobacterium multivorum]SUI98037.1 Protein of uncharacterised function (DUF3732) [Sphingobacterium multivorum]VXC29821.1 conserved hypothetical protein [Sphingobacterium multivorum]
MKFILHEIKLWFKDETAKPQSYYFLPNKVNVVTGGATTGKTSFWSIIDYCLLSSNINIANSIVESVYWFGMHFTIGDRKISIMRKSPKLGTPASDIYFAEGPFPIELYSNMDIAEAKAILDEEFGISDALRFPHGKTQGRTPFNLSYRYFLLFNALTEDIIGTSKTYFDTTFYGKEEYEKALTHIFDLVIGVNDMDNIKASERLRQVESEIRKIEKSQRDNSKAQITFDTETRLLLARCKEYGFVPIDADLDSVEAILEILNSIVTEGKKAVDNSKAFAQLDGLNRQRSILRAQMNELNRYNTDFAHYKRTLNKCADSLQPIVHLNEKLADQLVESYETHLFIDSLEASLRQIRENLSKNVQEPIKVNGDIKEIQSKIKEIDDRIAEINKISKEEPPEAQRILRLGELKNAYEQLLKREGPKPINTILLNQLNLEKENLERIPIDNEEIRRLMKDQLNASIQRNYNKLSSLPAYKNAQITFNSSDMVLQLLPANQMFPLENVGSKSNYMMMHLCFYLGLHEHMINVEQVHVPQFLFIDQPSIPYYTDNDNIGNEDKAKLMDAFKLINSFVKNVVEEKENSFQIFMVEHAPESYWKGNDDLDYFHTVDKFIDGKGLVPKENFKEK